MTNYSPRSGATMSEGVVSAIKSNPEGLLLLAAGCALLMRSGSSGGSGLFGGSRTAGQDSRRSSEYGSQRSTIDKMSEVASDTADQARRYVADVGSTVSETAKDYASSVGTYAQDAQRRVVDESERLMEQGRSTVSRVLQEQPLSVVLLGLATGAAVASLLPKTSVERETLGAVGDRLAEVAGNVRENLGEAASQAGEKLKQVADERGLNAEGLKEAAGEVAGAFGSAFKGEEQETNAQRGGRPGSVSGPSARGGGSGQQPGEPTVGQPSEKTGAGMGGASTTSSGSSSSSPSSRPAGSSGSQARSSSGSSGSSPSSRPGGSSSPQQQSSGSDPSSKRS